MQFVQQAAISSCEGNEMEPHMMIAAKSANQGASLLDHYSPSPGLVAERKAFFEELSKKNTVVQVRHIGLVTQRKAFFEEAVVLVVNKEEVPMVNKEEVKEVINMEAIKVEVKEDNKEEDKVEVKEEVGLVVGNRTTKGALSKREKGSTPVAKKSMELSGSRIATPEGGLSKKRKPKSMPTPGIAKKSMELSGSRIATGEGGLSKKQNPKSMLMNLSAQSKLKRVPGNNAVGFPKDGMGNWSKEVSTSVVDHGSKHFRKFEAKSLAREKWSVFRRNKWEEDLEKIKSPGFVAKKKAYFEEFYKKNKAPLARAKGMVLAKLNLKKRSSASLPHTSVPRESSASSSFKGGMSKTNLTSKGAGRKNAPKSLEIGSSSLKIPPKKRLSENHNPETMSNARSELNKRLGGDEGLTNAVRGSRTKIEPWHSAGRTHVKRGLRPKTGLDDHQISASRLMDGIFG